MAFVDPRVATEVPDIIPDQRSGTRWYDFGEFWAGELHFRVRNTALFETELLAQAPHDGATERSQGGPLIDDVFIWCRHVTPLPV